VGGEGLTASGTGLVLRRLAVDAAEELLEVRTELLGGRQLGVLGREQAGALLALDERVVLALQGGDDVRDLLVAFDLPRDLLPIETGGLDELVVGKVETRRVDDRVERREGTLGELRLSEVVRDVDREADRIPALLPESQLEE